MTIACARYSLCSALLPAVCALLLASDAGAAEAPWPVTAGREAFEAGRFPWYDSQTDALQPVELARKSEGRNWQMPSLGWLRWVAWTLLAVVLATLAYWLLWAVRNRLSGVTERNATTSPQSVVASVEALPFMSQRLHEDLLGSARRYYEQGHYSEAIIYLFSYELVELDRFAIIELARGKTNRQYLREAGRIEGARLLLERTMLAFESAFFGRHPLDRASFEACWNQLHALEALRAQTAG